MNRTRGRVRTLRRLSQRLDCLLDSLLEFSRVGRLDLAIGDTNLDDVLSQVLDSLRITLEEKGITVRIPEPLPTVQCDRVRIAEVFRNLVTNAMKYNDKPQQWIEIGFDRHPRAAGEPSGQAVPREVSPVFYVRDNGIGIREKHQGSIFRIFKRLHGRDKFGGGTGVGLTIVKKIIERHGGRIWIDSVVNEGTTFYFTLAGDPS